MPDILPYRDYDEHECLNIYTVSGAVPFSKGTFVKIDGSGFITDTSNPQLLGSVGASYNNVVSQRWGTVPYVRACTSTGDQPIGMTVYDVREVDENGEKLIYHPQKAYENNWRLSGQTVPVLTRGVVMYSGIIEAGSQITGGAYAYSSGGNITPTVAPYVVGRFLGTKDAHGWTLVKITL